MCILSNLRQIAVGREGTGKRLVKKEVKLCSEMRWEGGLQTPFS